MGGEEPMAPGRSGLTTSAPELVAGGPVQHPSIRNSTVVIPPLDELFELENLGVNRDRPA